MAGFDAYALSDVLPGSGLSSSAACEVLLGVIENHLFCRDELTAVEIAQMGQKAENLYFGKQSGLDGPDRLLRGRGGGHRLRRPRRPRGAVGGGGPERPGLRTVHRGLGGQPRRPHRRVRLHPQGDAGGAAFFGKNVLREVDEAQVLSQLPQLRKAAGDRAVLRALHFFADDLRAEQEADALERGDMDAFLALVEQSGRSSWELLQDITPTGGGSRSRPWPWL